MIAWVSRAVLVLLLLVVASGLVVASIAGESAGGAYSQVSQARTVLDELLQQRLAIDEYVGQPDGTGWRDYTESRARFDRSLQQLRTSAAGTLRASQVGQVAAAAAAWQRWADGVRGRMAAGELAADVGARLFSALHGALSAAIARLDADFRSAGRLSEWSAGAVAGVLLVGGVGIAVVPIELGRRAKQPRIDRMREVAAAAARIAAGQAVPIPHVERSDEVGLLAKSLRSVQELSAERGVLVDQAPVGICLVDNQRRIVEANAAMADMLGYTKDELTSMSILDLRPPGERQELTGALPHFLAGSTDVYATDRLWLHKNGSEVWCSLRVAAVRPYPGAPPISQIAISEDITERRRQARHAARIQRQLLPDEAPCIEGYSIAGVCRPALDVGGDFYDWLVAAEGLLDVTVADVMGKGVAAALLMATVRATLRAVPLSHGPLQRARAMSESLAPGITDDGLFVTLFNCRLDTATGELRYVDLGHGYFAVLGADGRLAPLARGCMPLGVQSSDGIEERRAHLEPGEALVVYSDGLVESEERTANLAELIDGRVDAEHAAEVVTRLMDRVPAHPADDVTVVVVRRQSRRPAPD